MAVAGPKPSMKVSLYFGLGYDQTTLDFVDVPIGNDLAVFADPSRLRSLTSPWASECNSLLQHFFEVLLEHVVKGDEYNAKILLSYLAERNEFHFGLSKSLSNGKAFGKKYADRMWTALTKSAAAKSGLLTDIEDTCLFIEGVGPDRISDAVCNILRGPLVRYTQDACEFYGIPLVPNMNSGPIWNPDTGHWDNSLISLPATPFGPLILVPKLIVRHKLIYDYSTYFTHHLLPAMQEHEKAMNTGLVHTLRDGRKRVTKKSLKEKYGADKLVIVEQTLRHPNALEEYRESAVRNSRPISHERLADIENIAPPNLRGLLNDVTIIAPGKASATAYEKAVEKLLTALFYPSLSHPTRQFRMHEGRKIVDIKFVNDPQGGFFHWLGMHYPASHIWVECKNYSDDLSNPEFDQLAGRFSPSKGQFGLLVCRSLENPLAALKRSQDTARDRRGYILVLTDSELSELVSDYIENQGGSQYPLLRTKFNELIM
ncbi:hypothetical protein P9875_22345 [Janthinobacterium rivuli]|uniref:Restriction endonuclease type IV Mrr domain-containing protein n=1 Tax=Janthinobacterium rivuli TaxID=2751478 RepID=A0ABY8I0N7_9BURK|nr:hypothetical protein [Janthinobacterium rivuli]WFR78419.1 hypothetical protein P9875_22345 [Janthinobacterium rivuli]